MTKHTLKCLDCGKTVEIKTAEEAKGITCESCNCRLFEYIGSTTKAKETK